VRGVKSRPWVIGMAALGAIVAFSLLLAPGFGASFLTKFKAKKLFYTKSQSDGRYLNQSQADARYLTPGQGDSRYLTPGTGDARYLPDSGEIRVNASPMTWQKTSGAINIGVNPSIGSTGFGGSTGAIDNLPVAIEPTLPTVLAGKPLAFVGANVCYINDTQTTIDVARINITTNTTGGGNTNTLLIDNTDRTDDACRTYTPTAGPHVMAPEEDISVELTVDYGTNAQFFNAGRATFIFEL
jgi:hypothetical protein